MPSNRPTMGPPNTPNPRPGSSSGETPITPPQRARGRNDGLTVGATGGFAGPTVRSGNTKASVGVGRNGSVGAGVRTRFAKGGSVSKRADGIAKKGKTKGKLV